MTLYSVLVAKMPLQTIDLTGITEVTVRELKKLYPISENTPEQPWHSMDDETRIIQAPDESAFEKLHIHQWNNPPYDLALYNEKPFIYGIQGNWNAQFLNDLFDYLKRHIKSEQGTELIRFWAGEYDRKLKRHSLAIEEIKLQDLENIKDEEYIRVIFK